MSSAITRLKTAISSHAAAIREVHFVADQSYWRIDRAMRRFVGVKPVVAWPRDKHGRFLPSGAPKGLRAWLAYQEGK
jgi:hypothetical protein